MVKNYFKNVIVKRIKDKKREKIQCGLNSYETEREATMGWLGLCAFAMLG